MRQISICLGCCRSHIAFCPHTFVSQSRMKIIEIFLVLVVNNKPMFNLKINEKHEKQKRQIDYSTFCCCNVC